MKWLSRDPIGELGGINLYGYVGNQPTRFVDPLGLQEMFFMGEVPPMARPVIPQELLQEAIRLNRPYNRCPLPDGRKVDLAGRAHPDEVGNPIETPHVHDPNPAHPPGFEQWPRGNQTIPRPATPTDIQDVIDVLKGGVKGFWHWLWDKPEPEYYRSGRCEIA